MGVCNCSMFCCTLLYIHSSIAIILMGEERAGCFAQFVILVSHGGWVAFPRGAMGLSAVCDCSISRSYSLTIFHLPHHSNEIYLVFQIAQLSRVARILLLTSECILIYRGQHACLCINICWTPRVVLKP